MRFVSALKKELQETMHDRAMLAVLLVFPVFVMVFMGSSFRSMEINGLPVGLSGPENISSNPLFSGLNGSQAFKLQSYGSEQDAMTDFRNGKLRAVILVPEDFEGELARGEGAEIRIVVDNSDIALQQSVLAALSSVVEASSTDITRSYVSSAWDELRTLNESAGSLASGIAITRANMNQTKASLAGVRRGIGEIGAGGLEASLDAASLRMGSMKSLIDAQRASLDAASEGNAAFLNQTGAVVDEAGSALNGSISTVRSTRAKLEGQVESLNETALALGASIAGLEALRASSSDPAIVAALDLNIAGLRSLKNTTEGQMIDAQDEIGDLESIEATLTAFNDTLSGYSLALDMARYNRSGEGELRASLDNASAQIELLNASFAAGRAEAAKLRSVVAGINATTSQIERTIDSAMEQTASVDALIGALQGTVAEQTGKNPERIASPLAISVEPQYERTSFVDFIMPQVIAISLLFSCFLLGSISLVRERMRRTIVRALLAPGALGDLVVGKIASLVLLSFVQVAAILIVALALFGVRPPENLAVLVYGTAISSLVLSSIGVLVGFFAKSESAAIQGCLLLAIPMLFLGNIIFSPDLLPAYTQVLQQLLPLAHVTSIYKIVLITNGDPAGNIAALLSYFVLLAALLAYIIFKRRDITDYTG